MIHTPSLTKVLSGLDVRALRAVQSLAQEQITARERMQAQLLRMTADYDSIGPLWTATTYGLGYVEKPGYMVLDGPFTSRVSAEQVLKEVVTHV